MAKTEPEFLNYLRELLTGVPGLRMRAMFGGHGVYSGDFMFGLVAEDEFYLKVDDANREQFLAEGCEPFIYNKQGKDMAMSYYRVPETALEDADEMLRWARLGIDAALRKATKKR
jgi:DNA transformation protein